MSFWLSLLFLFVRRGFIDLIVAFILLNIFVLLFVEQSVHDDRGVVFSILDGTILERKCFTLRRLLAWRWQFQAATAVHGLVLRDEYVSIVSIGVACEGAQQRLQHGLRIPHHLR